MKKLSPFLLLAFTFSANRAMAQRYNMSGEEGNNGLLIAGLLFLLVAVTVLIYYLRNQKNQ